MCQSSTKITFLVETCFSKGVPRVSKLAQLLAVLNCVPNNVNWYPLTKIMHALGTVSHRAKKFGSTVFGTVQNHVKFGQARF